MKQVLNFIALAGAGVLAIASTASAQSQPITWEASEPLFQGEGNETGPVAQSVIDNSNTFVLGINATQSETAALLGTTTVNGVVFTDVGETEIVEGFTQGGVTVTSTGNRATTTAFGSGSITDPELSNLMIGGLFDAATWTFTNLTPGEDYSIQIVTNDARGGGGQGGRDSNWQVGFGDGVTPIDPMVETTIAGLSILNNRDPVDLTGEQSGSTITGTFTAGADGTQTFDFLGTREGFPTTSGGTSQINALQLSIVSEIPFILGDASVNGEVDFGDISPFIALLANGGFLAQADINGDTEVTFDDIAGFIEILSQ